VHVIVSTDGSVQSLEAARHLKSFADPGRISDVTVVAVISPFAAVPFVNELGGSLRAADPTMLSFREEAEAATEAVAEEFADWGVRVQRQVRSGSPAIQLVEAATELRAGLLVLASGGRGLSGSVLLGSTAQRVQHSAPCPVLVARSVPRRD